MPSRRRSLDGADDRRLTTDSWSLYIAECADGSYYTGIAKDVAKRIEVHNAGRGAKYTSTHLPIKLLFQEPQKDYSAALKREYQVKRLSKAGKVRFAAGEPLVRPKKKAKMSFQRRKRKKRKRFTAETRRSRRRQKSE